MTLEEACLILSIKDKSEFNEDFINVKYEKAYLPTKNISSYLGDRIEGAYERIIEEFHVKGDN